MSLSIVINSASGIVVAADRRIGSYIHPVVADPEKYRLCPSGMVFFDACKKLVVYDSPHNFVAFTYTGESSINTHKLIEDLQQKLPPGRLSIKEYADALLKIFSENQDQYRVGHGPSSQDESISIYVTGFNEGSANAFLYLLELPSKPGPTPMSISPGGLVASGIGDHFDAAIKIFREKQIQELVKKIATQRKPGMAAKRKAKLRSVREGGLPWPGMSIQEMQDFVEFAIEHTVAEQARLNEKPLVGGGADIIRMTARDGVEIIKYEPHLEILKRPVADTHHNYIVLNCCGQEVEMQIDFELDNPLIESRLRYPTDEKFQCLKCGTSHDLTELRKVIQQIVRYHVIVDGKAPDMQT